MQLKEGSPKVFIPQTPESVSTTFSLNEIIERWGDGRIERGTRGVCLSISSHLSTFVFGLIDLFCRASWPQTPETHLPLPRVS